MNVPVMIFGIFVEMNFKIFKILNTMKTVKRMLVNYLRIYPVEREVTSTVNGVKSLRAGALILLENLPASNGQKASNAMELSGKQLDNLAGMHGIRATGRKGWLQFSTLVGVGKSACAVSFEEHQAGDTYVDATGAEQKYTKTSTQSTLDSVILPDRIVNKIVDATIDAIINWEEEDTVTKMLRGSAEELVPEELVPVTEGVK
jgi:hypothetical protein